MSADGYNKLPTAQPFAGLVLLAKSFVKHDATRGVFLGTLDAAGSALLGTGLILAIFAPFFSLPPFHKGLFFQAEPVSIALSIAAGATAMGMGLIALVTPNVIARLPLPAVVVAGIALASVIASPFHQNATRTWTGSLEFSDGALSFLWLSTFILAGYIMQQRRWLARLVIPILVLFPAVIIWANLSDAGSGKFEILWFNDYLAFYMAPLVLLYVATKTRCSSTVSNVLLVAVVGITFALAVNSESRAAYIAIAVSVLTWLTLSAYSFARGERLSAPAVGFILYGSMALFFIAVYFLGSSVDGGNVADQSRVLQSIWSRYQIINVAIASLEQHWSHWLTGIGWGSFRDAIVLLGMQNEDVSYEIVQNTLLTNWDALNRSVGHSHNMHLEAILGIGIAGPILYGLFYQSIALSANKEQRTLVVSVLVGHIFMASLWFMLPMVIGYLGIAIGILVANSGNAISSATTRASVSAYPARRFSAFIVFVGTAAVMFSSANFSWRGATSAERLLSSKLPGTSTNAVAKSDGCWGSDGLTYSDEYAGRTLVMVAKLAANFEESGELESAKSRHKAEIGRWLDRLICVSNFTSVQNYSNYLLYARLQARYLLSASGAHTSDSGIVKKFVHSWPIELVEFHQRGSSREELNLAYLLRLYKDERFEEIREFCDPGKSIISMSAACKLLSGMVLAEAEATRHEGNARVMQAVQMGIERYVALPGSLLSRYLAAGPPKITP